MPLPVPAFHADGSTTTAVGNHVGFIDESTGVITSWDYNWGDGNSNHYEDEGMEHPYARHAWTEPGAYSISLSVTGPDGNNRLVKTDYITVTA